MADSVKKHRGLKRRVGIVGFGHLGAYLVQEILKRDDVELAFVWNRSVENVQGQVEDKFILSDLDKFAERNPDLIVEVAHPSITEKYGEAFLDQADYMVGSPTALANQKVETKLREKASTCGHALYVPAGAFWGAQDIKKMADRGSLKGLKVTMRKHPSSFKLNGSLKEKNDNIGADAVVLYDGPVRDLCPLAPNNVNTMAAAAVAAHNLGFDVVRGCLVSDPSLTDFHVVEVDVTGPGDAAQGKAFTVKTVRTNPAQVGAVTGTATYASFLSSMLGARGNDGGVHLC
ncbi:putative L-aspartate dehydrogenase [Branchiostoma floridae]|uniref:Aspartate dehydrogenase domain-containing protein n=1 Tax=Branchiostoma floridae TaxID=7739 RepID=A0A9J7M0X7_BRAFL|nr:putative L-aspartate dehydrogenase [Branchiostoma floridae]XP_035691957.1 putative L-aspartate dehydrogenase [Branchiostoma floridae]XP_035691958.1 putative L-aspartate dehydrogenase [Branchiostoma floridae]